MAKLKGQTGVNIIAPCGGKLGSPNNRLDVVFFQGESHRGYEFYALIEHPCKCYGEVNVEHNNLARIIHGPIVKSLQLNNLFKVKRFVWR